MASTSADWIPYAAIQQAGHLLLDRIAPPFGS
jgi:hypothetical protein